MNSEWGSSDWLQFLISALLGAAIYYMRAKGEPYSVLEAHVSSRPGDRDSLLQKKAAIDEFVSNFENNHL